LLYWSGRARVGATACVVAGAEALENGAYTRLLAVGQLPLQAASSLRAASAPLVKQFFVQ